MPIHNQFLLDESHEPSPLALAVFGPTINVEIAVPTALAQQLSSAGQPIPPSHTGLALIDTGASVTAVDEEAIRALGIQPIDTVQLSTPSQASGAAAVYPVRMSFPQTAISMIGDGLSVIGCTLRTQGYIALLGRNFLARVVFTYNGPGGFFTIAF